MPHAQISFLYYNSFNVSQQEKNMLALLEVKREIETLSKFLSQPQHCL